MYRFGAVVRTGVATAAMMAGLTAPAPALAESGENAVVHWNRLALDTVLADGARRTPSAASLYVGITQAAVYDAAMAITQTHQPYEFEGQAAPGASVEAAVATAARDVLVHHFPAAAATLDAEHALTLAAVPDDQNEEEGVRIGHEAAATMIARRADDGRDADLQVPDGSLPGIWRRTSAGAAVTPYVAHVTPFLAESPAQFRPVEGPRPLTSHTYALEFDRTRLYGAATGSLRSAEQTEIARFWTENTVGQYNRALRLLAAARGLSSADSARLFAMTTLPAADAMITCWNTKYHYLAWRPVTAIRQADADGNPRTIADPTWQPLSTTALHPEYVSGHACLTGSITRGLRRFLGTKDIDFSIDSTVTQTTHQFATVDDLRREVEDARVFGGDHWQTGGTAGTTLGDALAEWALDRYFRRTS